MRQNLTKLIGFVLTLLCWYWATNSPKDPFWPAALIGVLPLLQFPIVLLGRRILNARPVPQRAQQINIFVHYAVMIVLGCSLFPAIRLIREQVHAERTTVLHVLRIIGQVLVWLTGSATAFSVLNLAIRGLGAPFAAKLSSRLTTDWMYAWTRNPMVLCTFAFLCSLGTRYESKWFLSRLILIVTPGWLYFVRVYEERELEIRFGEPYIK